MSSGARIAGLCGLALIEALSLTGCHGAAIADRGPTRPDIDASLKLDTMLVDHQCSNCHAVDYVRVGPSMTQLAYTFYQGTPEEAARLKASILNGSSGKWGEATMPPQHQVTPEQVDKIVATILSR